MIRIQLCSDIRVDLDTMQLIPIKNKKEVLNMIKELNRINELAKIQREVGLTEVEKEEQQQLRQHYLSQIRGQVLDTFTGLKVLDPLGNDVTPEKVREL